MQSDSLKLLRIELDQRCADLNELHSERLACGRGCSQCCVDSLTVFEIEAQQIEAQFGELLATGAPHPAGACAFLSDEGDCRIYDARPYVCRSQGLPLRWVDEDSQGEWVEYRDICPLNEGDASAEPIERLPAEACFELGPFEGRLAQLEVERSGEPRRVPLRALFRRTAQP